RARAGIGPSFRDEAVERRLIQRGPRALPHDLAVPLETVSFQRAQNVRGGGLAAARLVHVLDAHQPLPAGRGRVAIARERRDERAEVQRTGRRGREAAAVTRTARPHRLPLAAGSKRADSTAPALAGGGLHVQCRRMADITALGYSGWPRLP